MIDEINRLAIQLLNDKTIDWNSYRYNDGAPWTFGTVYRGVYVSIGLTHKHDSVKLEIKTKESLSLTGYPNSFNSPIIELYQSLVATTSEEKDKRTLLKSLLDT